MNSVYSEDSTGENKKEEEYVKHNEKVLNDNNKYQEDNAPVQVLSQEKAPHQASVYSSFHMTDEDVNGGTSMRVRKEEKRRIIVCVGFLAVILMLIALVFTLLYTSLVEKKNITLSSDSTITAVPTIPGNTKKQQNKEMQLDKAISESCIETDETYLNPMKKLSNGSEELLSKETQMRKCILDGCIGTDEVCLNQMKRLSNCTEKLQNREMQMRSFISDGCLKRERVCFSQMKKLLNGTEDQQNKEIHMRNTTLDGCIKNRKV
uniref:Uncharacterized protein n=1 Tax=Plectus sambesii TaxID=2011161 RepID=A0A914XR35_9BILA